MEPLAFDVSKASIKVLVRQYRKQGTFEAVPVMNLCCLFASDQVLRVSDFENVLQIFRGVSSLQASDGQKA